MTQVSWRSVSAVLLAGLVMLGSAGVLPGKVVSAQAQGGGPELAGGIAPRFEPDPAWPKPLPEGTAWPELTRAATSVAVDSRDHVWNLPGASVRQPVRRKAAGTAVPRLFEFDAAGNLVRAWGGPGKGYQWMEALVPNPIWPAQTPPEHGMFIDHKDNVWVTGNRHVALKFSRDGKFLFQIGELWKTNGSNDRRLLGNPCELTVEPATNELYIADGYINRRIIVFDAETGVYKRHWGVGRKRPIRFAPSQRKGRSHCKSGRVLPSGRSAPAAVALRTLRPRFEGRAGLCVRSEPEPDPGLPAKRHVRARALMCRPTLRSNSGSYPGREAQALARHRQSGSHPIRTSANLQPRRQHECQDLDLQAPRSAAARSVSHEGSCQSLSDR